MSIRAKLKKIDVWSTITNKQEVSDWQVEVYEKKKAAKCPPILVVEKRNKNILLLDGFHRITAFRNKGRNKIKAWVLRWEAFRKMLKANGYKKVPYSFCELDEFIICDGKTYDAYRE